MLRCLITCEAILEFLDEGVQPKLRRFTVSNSPSPLFLFFPWSLRGLPLIIRYLWNTILLTQLLQFLFHKILGLLSKVLLIFFPLPIHKYYLLKFINELGALTIISPLALHVLCFNMASKHLIPSSLTAVIAWKLYFKVLMLCSILENAQMQMSRNHFESVYKIS